MVDEAPDPQSIGRPDALTTLDKQFVVATALPALAALIGLFLAPTWQLGLATVFLALIPWCAATALHRRRSARSLLGDEVPPPEVGRAAARLHLQEMGFVLLAVVLLFAAGGAVATLE